jgi:putative endopeptidase
MRIRSTVVALARAMFAVGLGVSAVVSAQSLPVLADIDPQTPACKDFYRHANGRWLTSTPIPETEASVGLLEMQTQLADAQLQALLAASPQTAVGALYAAALNQAAIDQVGLSDLQPWFTRIDKLKRSKDVTKLIADWHAAGVPVLFNLGTTVVPGQTGVGMVHVTQAGLGLPDRDYYLREDAQVVQIRAAYRAYIERLLGLAGDANAAADSALVLQVETDLARASMSLAQLADPANATRLLPLKQLDRTYPNLGFKALMRTLGARDVEQVSAPHSSYLAALDQKLTSLPITSWKAWFRFHLMHRAAPYLGGVYAQAYDELFRQTLSGEAAQTPEQRAVAIVRRVLAAELAATYAAAQVDSARTAAAQGLVDGALEQYRQAIGKAIWLGEPARAEALKKLDALRVEIGGPAMPSRALPMPDPQRLIASLMAIAKAEQAQRWRADATPAAWPIPATSPLPLYVAEENRLLIPAGALQSPLFDPAADLSAQWGGLGALIARELMHAVDGKGATINAKGESVAWWQTSDADAFVLRVRPLIAQYGAFEVLPGFALDGDATLYENIADLGGLQIAWAAFVAAGGESGPVVQGSSAAQRFFLSWAQVWKQNSREAAARLNALSLATAPNAFRVNGPLAHHNGFSSVYRCHEGSEMRLPEAARATVW